jgi:protein required for attachment to host cells
MNKVWVLVCDAGRGRVFSVSADEPSWDLVESFRNDDVRTKASELVTDREGRGSSLGGSAHHNALAPSSSLKEQSERRFVHEVTSFLEREALEHRFHRLLLVAPPQMLGMLKGALSAGLGKRLLKTVDKDFSELSMSDLAERLREAVRIPPDQLEVLNGPVKHRH